MNTRKIIKATWILSIILYGLITSYGLSPNFTIHLYRQAQTAMTSLYLPIDGYRLNYSTPIMGSPWSVPLEFPLFQMLANLVKKFTGMDLIVSGKIINIILHIINNLLIIQIFKKKNIDKEVAFCGLIFYNLCPYYLIFDTTFLIDPLSLWLAITSIYFLVSYLSDKGKLIHVIFFLASATLTGISKSTTFIGMLAPLTALLLVEQIVYTGSLKNIFQFSHLAVRRAFISGSLFMVSFVVMYAWVKYSDVIKTQNPLSNKWVSANLWEWNLGTIKQRLSFSNWKTYVSYSMMAHPAFYSLIAAGIIAFSFYAEKKEKIIILCLFALFIFPPALFFNLFLVHTYYSISNMIFLFMIIGLIIYVLIRQERKILHLTGLALGIVSIVFGLYRDIVFSNLILKNKPEPGVSGKLNQINFKPGKNDVLVIVQESRDPYFQYYFKCRGINLNSQEYEQYGRKDKLQRLAGSDSIRMICIGDNKRIDELPGEFNGILTGSINHKSILDEQGDTYYYNFFWY